MIATAIFILILSFLVIIHELGHFLTAKWFKVITEEFGLGYPPRVATLFKWKETKFSLNWIPFGGFVQMFGENGDEEVSSLSKNKLQKLSKQGLKPFYDLAPWKRLIIIVAGVTVNFLFGALAFAGIYLFKGIPEFNDAPVIAEIQTDSAASKADLASGDAITTIFGLDSEVTYAIASSQDVIDAVQAEAGSAIAVTIERCSETQTCENRTSETTLPALDAIGPGQGLLGVGFDNVSFTFYPLYQHIFLSLWNGVVQTVFLSQVIVVAVGELLGQLIRFDSVPADVAGPVGIVHQASQTGILTAGWAQVLNFAGILSVNLAIMNILPIPALDGGRAVVLLLEWMFGKGFVEKWEKQVTYGGFIVLIGLLLLVTVRDVVRIFYG